MNSSEEKNTISVPHCVCVENRNKISLTGVRDVDSFDEETITLITGEGELSIKGCGLHIGKLSTDTGEMSIEGKVDALVYSSETPKQSGFFGRVFR